MDALDFYLWITYLTGVAGGVGATLLVIAGLRRARANPSPRSGVLQALARRVRRDGGNQDGNIFIALFGAVALTGVLSASMMQLIRGPITTAVNVNRNTTAESHMMTGAQLAMTMAAGQSNDGDCDSDTMVEPLPWKAPSGDPSPQDASGSEGGGLIPDAIGASKTDPWGTPYGYCIWDHGNQIDHSNCGGASQNRLPGTDSDAHIALAVISAGRDKDFQTACKSFATADADNSGDLNGDEKLLDKPGDSDDIVYSRTYQEAAEGSGGLWALKSGDPDTATIGKDVEVGSDDPTGGGTDNRMFANDGLVLGQYDFSTNTPACSALTNDRLIVFDSNDGKAKICNNGTWENVGGMWILDGGTGNIYRPNNRVGIGTSTPAAKLDVNCQ